MRTLISRAGSPRSLQRGCFLSRRGTRSLRLGRPPLSAANPRYASRMTKMTRMIHLSMPARAQPSAAALFQRRAYAKPADVAQIFQEKRAWDAFPDDIQKIVVYAEHARSHNYQIPSISRAFPGTDLRKAYHITAAGRALRESANGEVVVGRKIGFTNSKVWAQLGVEAPVWSYMYNTTVVDLPGPSELSGGRSITANLSQLSALQPNLEPEIVFKMSRSPAPTMNDAELLSCIEWVAHGFEMVFSLFPGPLTSPVDCVSAFGFHGMLLVGPKTPASRFPHILEDLATFRAELYRNGRLVQAGGGSNVLGSPINALLQTVKILAADEHNPQVRAGEIITTGSLAGINPIKDGETWSTKLDGIDLPGLEVKFQLNERAAL